MSTMSLADFLLARIGEKERRARALLESRDMPRGMVVRKHFAIDLAGCLAERRIVEEHQPANQDPEWVRLGQLPSCSTCGQVRPRRFPCPTLRFLAAPYADHPDFRSEWRP